MQKIHIIKTDGLLFAAIFLANLFHFIGLEYSPPGFYMDEAFGAVQALCIQLSGQDFLGNPLPLFAVNAVGNVYTPPFLYGEVLWTFIFGNSVTGFRSFIGFVTSLTILFIYLFVKNRVGSKAALWVAFAGSIMPWSFIFSRIAWDPPLATLFISMFLWSSTFKKYNWIAGVFLAFAAYSYPPMRLMAPVLLVLMPGVSLRFKLINMLVAGFVCMPLAWYMLSNQDFMIRSHMMAIWSPFYGNPFRNYEIDALLKVIWINFSSHFGFNFLFLHGEHSLRSSIQTFGMLSWLDLFAYAIIPIFLIWGKFRTKGLIIFTLAEKQLIYLGIIGVILSCIPSSLTHEGVPNAVRSLTMWLFFSLLTGMLISKFLEKVPSPFIRLGLLGMGISFFVLFLFSYFIHYPVIAKEAFQMDYFTAYSLPKVQKGSAHTCKDIREYFEVSARPEVYVGDQISFAESFQPSSKLLWDNWYEKEAWGVWSNGKRASLHFPKRDKASNSIDLEIKGLITGKNPSQLVRVKINGEVTPINLSSANAKVFRIPISNPSNNSLSIEIETPDAKSPMQAGFSNGDNRKLGIGLISVTFN